MKIAINCIYYGEKSGGIKEYIYNLVINLVNNNHSLHDFLFYVSKDDEDFWKKTMPETLNYKVFPFSRKQKLKRAFLQNEFWQKEEIIEKFDIFHSPFFHIPTILKCKKIMTVHDLRFRRYPRSYPFSRYVYIKNAFKKSIELCDAIITVSEFTKKEILKFYSINPEKIFPIHEAIDYDKFSLQTVFENSDSYFQKRGIEKKKYILSIGHLEPRKNFINLIKAYLELKKKNKIEYSLIIVGKKNYHYKREIDLIQKSNDVFYLDFVTEKELLNLYSNAAYLVFPSYYEGFGFPPLEAAAMNTPSIVSNASCIPEICGNGAIYFNPFDVDDIKDKLTRMKDEKVRKHILNLAKKNLLRFSWQKNAIETIKVYKKVSENGR